MSDTFVRLRNEPTSEMNLIRKFINEFENTKFEELTNSEKLVSVPSTHCCVDAFKVI